MAAAWTGPTAGRPASTRRKLLFAAVAVVLGLGAVELAARLLWSPPGEDPGQARDGRMRPDPALRWRLSPGRVTYGGAPAAVNRHGYRGGDFEVKKAPCTFRVLAAGDSSVFGHGVADGETFVASLPALLQRRAPAPLSVEAINGAVPGYSTYQSLALLERSGWATEPDLLLIANIWSDGTDAGAPDRRHFRSTGMGTWDTALPWLGDTLEHSRASLLVSDLLREPRQVDAHGISRGRYLRVPPAEYAANLTAMVRGVRRRGGEALLMVLPHPTDQRALAGAHRAQARRDLASDGAVEMNHDHRQAMRRVARQTRAPLLDLSALAAPVQDELFIDRLHPNAAGHAFIARQLARVLLRDPKLFSKAAQRCEHRQGKTR